MRAETKLLITSEIMSHGYCSDDWEEYNFDGLFQKYLGSEIYSIHDLTKNHSEFVELILQNFDVMDKSGLEGSNDANKYSLLKSDLQSIVKDFLPLDKANSSRYVNEQTAFASIVNTLAPLDKSVLDVGAGKIPLSSALIAEGREKPVLAMDKAIAVPDYALGRLNVTKVPQMFDGKSELDDVDIIVGDKPCKAIEEIVGSGKPYILRLCDCYAPQNGDIDSWRKKLEALDKLVKIDKSGEFVTNLDITPKAFSELVARVQGAVGGKPKAVCDVDFEM